MGSSEIGDALKIAMALCLNVACWSSSGFEVFQLACCIGDGISHDLLPHLFVGEYCCDPKAE